MKIYIDLDNILERITNLLASEGGYLKHSEEGEALMNKIKNDMRRGN